MRETLLTFLTAKLQLAGVAIAAAALSTSAVAFTTVSDEQPLAEEGVVEVVDDAVLGEGEGTEDDVVVDGGLEEGTDDGLEDLLEEGVEESVEEDALEEDGEVAAEEVTPDAGDLPPCPADVKNHGAYVSAVARDKSVRGAEHGARVSAAAQSDCGKPGPGEETELAEEPELEGSEGAAVEQQSAPGPAKVEKRAGKAEKAGKAGGGAGQGGAGNGDAGNGGGGKKQ